LRTFFCAATAPINLAVFRLAVFGWLWNVIYHTNFAGLVSFPADLRVAPPGYEYLLPRIPFDVSQAITVRHVALAFGAMALVGLFTRLSALITCVCALYLLGLEEVFGKIFHQYQHLVWFAALLAAAPSGDAVSIDALLRRWRRAVRGAPISPAPSVAYALPLRFVWLLIGVIYFFPGLAKLHAGPEWFLSDNLKYLMYSYWSRKNFVPWFRIDHYPLLYRSAALATVLFEVSFIACVFNRRLRLLAAAGGVIFHWMTATYLGLVFWSLVICYTAFIDWAALFKHLRRLVESDASIGAGEPRTLSMLPRRSSRPVVIVGSVLLIANVYCGVRAIDSWPFSVYPRFAEVVRSTTRRSLEVVARSATGASRPAQIDIPEGVVNRILETDDASERARCLGGVRTLIRHWSKLAPGESAQMFAVERSVLPEERDRDPLRRELLLEVQADK